MNDTSVYERFKRVAAERGDAPFLDVLDETAKIYGIDAGGISYADMSRRVVELSAALADAGYGAGHRVGLLVENRPVFFEIWLALNGIGASVVPINPDLRSSELEYILHHSEMNAAFVLADRVADVEAARASDRAIPVMVPGSTIHAPYGGASDVVAGEVSNECALLYTSGTTGRPKGCVLSNEYFIHAGDWYRDAGGLISLRPAIERMLTPLPIFHMNAMAASFMGMLSIGGCLIVLDRFHPRSWWQQVRASGATCLHYLGVMPSILMGAPAREDDREHTVRFGFGAGVDRLLHAPFEERFGFPLLEAWAMTETGCSASICANHEPRKIGTNCFGRPTEKVGVRIVDSEGADVPDGVPGELLVRHLGPDPRFGFFREYLKDPEATAQAWRDGWFHTGDIVSRDAEGDLHFVDRKKNVIRRSGENISAVEVESVLARHPHIRQIAIAATEDLIRGDEVAALVVADGAAESAEAAEELVRWALERMAYFKVPGWVAFVTSVPLTPTEKIQRNALKVEVARLMENGAFHDTRHLKKRQI